MTFEEFEQVIRTVAPGASFEEDNYGQIVVYTDLMWDVDSGDDLVPFIEDDDE